jgi:hypothetical protein
MATVFGKNASMSSPIENLIEEVDEDLRKDRALALMRRYGPYALALTLGVIIAVAGVVTWRHYSAQHAMERAAIYSQALEAINRGDADESQRLLNEITSAAPGSGYGTLSRLQEAALKAKGGDAAGAAAAYDAIAGDTRVDPLFRDLATVLYALSSLDSADPAQLAARLQPLADGKGPWRYTAMEASAYLALRTGDNDRARDLFSRIANDSQAPEEARGRAAAMASTLAS